MADVQVDKDFIATDKSIQLAATTAPGRFTDTGGHQGKTTIADGVISKLVGIAAREVDGVHDLVSTGPGGTISGLASRVTRGDQRGQGVLVEVGEHEVAVDLKMVVLYGVNIPQLADVVRGNISDRVFAITGLIVKEVNIGVTDLYFPDDEKHQQSRVE